MLSEKHIELIFSWNEDFKHTNEMQFVPPLLHTKSIINRRTIQQTIEESKLVITTITIFVLWFYFLCFLIWSSFNVPLKTLQLYGVLNDYTKSMQYWSKDKMALAETMQSKYLKWNIHNWGNNTYQTCSLWRKKF